MHALSIHLDPTSDRVEGVDVANIVRSIFAGSTLAELAEQYQGADLYCGLNAEDTITARYVAEMQNLRGLPVAKLVENGTFQAVTFCYYLHGTGLVWSEA